MRAYVFVETKAGKARAVAETLHSINLTAARVLSVETVTGPWDVITIIEGTDTEGLGQVIAEKIQKIDGVERTMSSFAFRD